eukprot:TRINITY_DN3653_c0_g2_i11.p1 TRINITY_DN3653_c0_g2~~TRINITY_DN3653_c0_g2_i11.p1  ORF type:complete len:162 (+),score=5.39 TRINITY_DN3653_c0_g2_i11:255-740(+)
MQLIKLPGLKWKLNGVQSKCFNTIPALHAKVLNEWEILRATMPERNYKIPKGSVPLRHTKDNSLTFPEVSKEIYPKKFQCRLARAIASNRKASERSFRSRLRSNLPRIFDKAARGILSSKAGYEFGWDKHTVWKLFEKPARSKSVLEAVHNKISKHNFTLL